MPELPQITDAEWEVMKVVWDKGPLTSGQIVEALAGDVDWHSRTVKTLLARLVKKGAVSVDVDDRRHLYKAAIKREACQRQETRSFVRRVFDGAVGPAVVHFIQAGQLSAEEIKELRRILDQEGR
jgi:BlaI family transcriptional regulator, penicillinase repressor